jgi:hypothetical protein
MAFRHIPGSPGVEFFPADLFSPQALGGVVAYSSLLMLCWVFWFCFPQPSPGSFVRFFALVLTLAFVGTVMHALHAGFESEQDGWRSDLVAGGGILFGDATVYGILLRRGNRDPPSKGRFHLGLLSLPWTPGELKASVPDKSPACTLQNEHSRSRLGLGPVPQFKN